MGAQPSRAVHRILSYIDYMPKPRPAYGENIYMKTGIEMIRF